MAIKQMFCPKCGAEMRDSKTGKCVNCGENFKASLYKKWCLGLMICVSVMVLGGAIFIANGWFSDGTAGMREDVSQGELNYEVVDLQVLFDDLDENASRAKERYQDKYVQFEGKIVIFDGDGVYIRVKSKHADTWDSSSILCYITAKEQNDFLARKSQGDSVTIRGRITRVGKIQGYSLRIHEIE